MVLRLSRTVGVALPDREVNVPLSYAEGMIGALPVFAAREDAERIAQGRYSILEASADDPGDTPKRGMK